MNPARPPALEFMQHSLWEGVRILMATEERSEEEDYSKQHR